MTAIRLKGDDEVIGMEVVEHLEQQLLVVTEQGFGKRTDVADFPVKHRATGGVIANSLNADTGDVAAIRLVGRDEEELMLITELGTILRTEVGGINRYRRAVARRHGHEAAGRRPDRLDHGVRRQSAAQRTSRSSSSSIVGEAAPPPNHERLGWRTSVMAGWVARAWTTDTRGSAPSVRIGRA